MKCVVGEWWVLKRVTNDTMEWCQGWLVAWVGSGMDKSKEHVCGVMNGVTM